MTALVAALLLAWAAVPLSGRDFDVVIYGGTPAGIIAGVAAAREGAAVVIVEPSRWVGGMVTGGLTRTDTGRVETIGGYTREFFGRAAQRYGGKFMWFAEPQVNLATFEAMLREARIEVVKDRRLGSVQRAGARIVSVTTDDGRVFAGRQFIDATYEGDLMARAGVTYVVGREGRAQYGEPLAGFFPMPLRPHPPEVMASDCACVGGKGPHYIHGTPVKIPARDAQGRLLWGVTESGATAGAADGLTQAYNFRVVVTRRPEIRVPFPRPKNYEAGRYELLLRLIQAYPVVRFARLFHLGEVAAGKFDLNAQGLCSTDLPGGNVGL